MHITSTYPYLLLTSLFVAACSSGSSEATDSESADTSATGTDTSTGTGTDTNSTPTDGGVETTVDTTLDTTLDTTAETTVESTTEAAPTSTTGATETSSESGGETTTDTTTGGEQQVLSNMMLPCAVPDFTFPLLPGEAGHLAATTLTPPVYPFDVTAVRYELGGETLGKQCNNTLEHLVEIQVSNTEKPDGVPSMMASSFTSITVPADAAATQGRQVELPLDPPMTIGEGQFLIVAVKLVGSEDNVQSICLQSCTDGEPIAGVDWWSQAIEEPYMWADMVADFGFATNFTISAVGTAG